MSDEKKHGEYEEKQTMKTDVFACQKEVDIKFTFPIPENLVEWLLETLDEDWIVGVLLENRDIRRKIVAVLSGEETAGWSSNFPDYNDELRIETLEGAGEAVFAEIVKKLASAVEQSRKYYNDYFKLYHWIQRECDNGAFKDESGCLAGMPRSEHVQIFSPESEAAKKQADTYMQKDLIPMLMEKLGIAPPDKTS